MFPATHSFCFVADGTYCCVVPRVKRIGEHEAVLKASVAGWSKAEAKQPSARLESTNRQFRSLLPLVIFLSSHKLMQHHHIHTTRCIRRCDISTILPSLGPKTRRKRGKPSLSNKYRLLLSRELKTTRRESRVSVRASRLTTNSSFATHLAGTKFQSKLKVHDILLGAEDVSLEALL